MTPLAYPLLLLLAVLTPLCLEKRWFRKLKKPKTVEGFSLAPFSFAGASPESLRQKLMSPLLSFLLIGAFLSMVYALSRPYDETQTEVTEASGRDILLALDVSKSMEAIDFSLENRRVSRLEALKTVVGDFIKQRAGDRLGLVVFGEEAYTQCPLTLDNQVVLEYVSVLTPGIAGNSTAIGEALAISLKRIREIEADSKVVVLVTDGKNNAGSILPLEAAHIAKSMGVKVHTIGIGGSGRAQIPARGIFGGSRLRQQFLEFDGETLEKIAEITGGKYFRADDTSALREVYKEIDKLEVREDNSEIFTARKEHYPYWLQLSIFLLGLYYLLGATVFYQPSPGSSSSSQPKPSGGSA